MLKVIGFEGNLRRYREIIRCNHGVAALLTEEGMIHNPALNVEVEQEKWDAYEEKGIVFSLKEPIPVEGTLEDWHTHPAKRVFACNYGQDANVDEVLKVAWPAGSYIKKEKQGNLLIVITSSEQIEAAAKRAQDFCEEKLTGEDDKRLIGWIEAVKIAFRLRVETTKGFLKVWKRTVHLKKDAS